MQVLDASALLAFLHGEPGTDRVRPILDGAIVSAVNWAEVIQKALRAQADVVGMGAELADMGVVIEPFTHEQAEIAAYLWQKTRAWGLSLADRACLALAIAKKAPVWTADRAWGALPLGIDIRLLR